jgi:hypothetical protein
MFAGSWENGDFLSGNWEFKGAGGYEGQFKLGRFVTSSSSPAFL